MLTAGDAKFFLRFDVSMTNPVRPFTWSNQGFTVHHDMNARITNRQVV